MFYQDDIGADLRIPEMKVPISVIDLFAGPGGLGEGFSFLRDANGRPVFQVRLSVEKDHFAHRTLELRSFFRKFPDVRGLYIPR